MKQDLHASPLQPQQSIGARAQPQVALLIFQRADGFGHNQCSLIFERDEPLIVRHPVHAATHAQGNPELLPAILHHRAGTEMAVQC